MKYGILTRVWVWLMGVVLGMTSISVQVNWQQITTFNRTGVVVGLVALAIYTTLLIQGAISIERTRENEHKS